MGGGGWAGEKEFTHQPGADLDAVTLLVVGTDSDLRKTGVKQGRCWVRGAQAVPGLPRS